MRVVRVKDVARVELAAVDYSTNSYLDGDPAVALVESPITWFERARDCRQGQIDLWTRRQRASPKG